MLKRQDLNEPGRTVRLPIAHEAGRLKRKVFPCLNADGSSCLDDLFLDMLISRCLCCFCRWFNCPLRDAAKGLQAAAGVFRLLLWGLQSLRAEKLPASTCSQKQCRSVSVTGCSTHAVMDSCAANVLAANVSNVERGSRLAATIRFAFVEPIQSVSGVRWGTWEILIFFASASICSQLKWPPSPHQTAPNRAKTKQCLLVGSVKHFAWQASIRAFKAHQSSAMAFERASSWEEPCPAGLPAARKKQCR